MKLLRTVATLVVATGVATSTFADEMPSVNATKFGYKEFRMGILGGESAQDRQKSYTCFMPYVSKMLGVPAKIYLAKDYAGTMEGLLEIDYAWLGPSGYAGVYLRDPDAVKPIMTRRQQVALWVILRTRHPRRLGAENLR